MEFDQIIRKRKSVKEFKSKKAPWKLVIEAIDTALQGPFAGNHNFLKFLITEDPEIIKFIAKQCDQIWISQVEILVLVLSDDKHLENIYGDRGRVYSRQQAGAAIQTMLLKLVDLGLSSCWIGSYDDDSIKSKLKIPKDIQIEAILPIGYEDSKKITEKKPKKALDVVLFWEIWNQKRRPSIFEEGVEDYRPQ